MKCRGNSMFAASSAWVTTENLPLTSLPDRVTLPGVAAMSPRRIVAAAGVSLVLVGSGPSGRGPTDSTASAIFVFKLP